MEIEGMAEKYGTNTKPNCGSGRHTNRGNYEGVPENYFRSFIFIPYLDHLISWKIDCPGKQISGLGTDFGSK